MKPTQTVIRLGLTLVVLCLFNLGCSQNSNSGTSNAKTSVTTGTATTPSTPVETILHDFTNTIAGSTGGASPNGDLILSGSTYYGLTALGGENNQGTIFSIGTNGTGFTVLHSFSTETDGQQPKGSLVLSGSTLYGMTSAGGASGYGTIFSIGIDGTGFTVLHSFASGATDGESPQGSLTLSGSTLYGMTEYGGAYFEGTIFSIGTDGSGFTILYSFTGASTDGANPCGNLTLSGSTLYGMAQGGGASGLGTAFSIGTDGSGFTLLHSFAGGANDGRYPFGSLILANSTLYGMTTYGGNNDEGTIFSIATDGTGFTLLDTFTGGANDGGRPQGSLILSNGTIYGMTQQGGANSVGAVFSIGSDGTGFTLLHSFSNQASDGENPYGSLLLYGSTLYGMTSQGGSNNNSGTIFSIATDGSGFATSYSFGSESIDGASSYANLTASADGKTLYGMTYQGGASEYGTIFSIGTDGTGYTLLHSFTGGATDGGNPYGSLLLSGSTLYGMAQEGGANGAGTIFSISSDGTGFTLLHSFAGGASDGSSPVGNLLLSGSTLYGMTQEGGANSQGTIFSIHADGTGFTLLHSFSNQASDGEMPRGSLILSGNTLYGMTNEGGAHNKGAVFSMGIDGTAFTLLHSFVGGTTDGAYPSGSLILSGNTLYGMTQQGGSPYQAGTIFQLGTDGTGYATLHAFSGGDADGYQPNGDLTLSSSGILYGMTSSGGTGDAGTVFSVGTDGTRFTLLHSFTAGTTDGENPYGNLTLSGNNLYGMTSQGGSPLNVGVIFQLAL